MKTRSEILRKLVGVVKCRVRQSACVSTTRSSKVSRAGKVDQQMLGTMKSPVIIPLLGRPGG